MSIKIRKLSSGYWRAESENGVHWAQWPVGESPTAGDFPDGSAPEFVSTLQSYMRDLAPAPCAEDGATASAMHQRSRLHSASAAVTDAISRLQQAAECLRELEGLP